MANPLSKDQVDMVNSFASFGKHMIHVFDTHIDIFELSGHLPPPRFQYLVEVKHVIQEYLETAELATTYVEVEEDLKQKVVNKAKAVCHIFAKDPDGTLCDNHGGAIWFFEAYLEGLLKELLGQEKPQKPRQKHRKAVVKVGESDQ